jgi:VanZ family protein
MNDSTRVWINRSILPALLYMGMIFAISSIPDDDTFPGGAIILAYPNLNNFLHIPLFGGLAWFWLGYFKSVCGTRRAAEIATVVTCGLFSVSDEIHQYFVPGRFASITDILLDLIGISAALWWARRRAASQLSPASSPGSTSG